MHLGDNRLYTEEFREFAGRVDWLFLSMGKMSFKDMVSLVGDVAPKYLVPMHYRPGEGDILEARYTFPFPSAPPHISFPHLLPDADIREAYIQRLKDDLNAAGVATQMVILKPGRKTGFDFLPEPE